MKSLLSIGLMAGLFTLFYFKLWRVEYPALKKLELENSEILNVTVFGRNDDTLIVAGRMSGNRFELPIEDLSKKGKLFSSRFPKNSILPVTPEIYEFRAKIFDTKNRELDAMILGREGEKLILRRETDDRIFEVPFSSMSLEDRLFAHSIREGRLPPRDKPTPPETDPYIISRLEKIKELEAKQEIMKREISSNTLSDLIQENRRIELLSLEKELRSLNVAIDTYRWRTKKE